MIWKDRGRMLSSELMHHLATFCNYNTAEELRHFHQVMLKLERTCWIQNNLKSYKIKIKLAFPLRGYNRLLEWCHLQ